MMAQQSPPSHIPYYQQSEVHPLSFSRAHSQAAEAGAAAAAHRRVGVNRSNFLMNSLSDISLEGFEEQLARISASDTFVAPPRLRKE